VSIEQVKTFNRLRLQQTLATLGLLVAGGMSLIGASVHPAAVPNLSYTQQRNDPQVSSTRLSIRSTGATVTPYMADEFADSFGVNTRFGTGIYAKQRPAVTQYLAELGFRHIRDGGTIYNAETRAFLRGLCTGYGIHPSFGLADTDSDAAILQYAKDVPCIDMVEGPNELNGEPNWAERLATFIPHAYTLVRSTPAFDNIPFVGPSITKLADDETLTKMVDISKYLDYGNKHSYPGQRNPGGEDGSGARGWGPTHEACPKYGYGAYFFTVCASQVLTKDRPVWTTETGYGSTPTGLATPLAPVAWAPIPNDVAAKYLPRLMAYEFENGITRTYIMALLDGASGCGGPFNQLGLIEQDCPNTGLASSLHIKPGFTALKNLMATVGDPGPAFHPKPLTIKIAGADEHIQTLLLEKRSGQVMLLYWNERSDWDVIKGRYVTVAPVPITVTIGGAGDGTSARNVAIDKSGSLTPAQTIAFSNDTAELSATDEIQILSFTPGAER
jgi:hypothetical protein